MFNRLFNILTWLAAAFFIAVLVVAAPSFFDPEFEVVNASPGPVAVVATWRDAHKTLGTIEPSSSVRLTLDDEAAMTLHVRYADGRRVETEPLYFTQGIRVIARINNDGVEFGYDPDR